MANKWQSVDIVAARFARLEANGVPDPGPNNLIVTTDLTQVAYTWETEAGVRSTQKTGGGNVCFTRETDDKLLGNNPTFDLCFTDAELMELTVGAVLLTESGESIGWEAPTPDATPPFGVSVETWSLAWENDQPKLHPITGAQAYLRRAWAKVRFSLGGSVTLAEGLHIQQIVGKGSSNVNFYDGPGNDIPIGEGGPYREFLSDAPPAATDGYATLAAS